LDNAANTAIITNYEAMLGAIRGFVDLIERFRGGVDDMIIAGYLTEARAALDAGKLFDETTTAQQIDKVLGV
jgi:hypothetical protein